MSVNKIEFLMCGSPNDAFYSQAAIFRLFLDAHGGIYEKARLVLCLGDEKQVELPGRWKPYFGGIDVQWAPKESFLEFGDGGDHVFSLLDETADISVLCDADTALLRPMDNDLLANIVDRQSIAAVIAQYPPPFFDTHGHDYSLMSNKKAWQKLAEYATGNPDIPLNNKYLLQQYPDHCPFYVNYGFVIAPPKIFRQLHAEINIAQTKLREILDNDFYAQIGVALATFKAGLDTHALPLRYNYPNDRRADAMYPDELENVCVLHYQRTDVFDRHKVFATASAFNEFIAAEMTGSDAAFQRFVRNLTGGVYPFT